MLSAGELLDVHAAAAAALRGWGAVDPHERLARRAHHALRAAARSPADARRAVDACRAAAASMVARFAYEEAARLLGTAAGLSAGAPAPAALLLEWARAVLWSGRLTEARELFDRAADAAEAEGEPVLAAHAALGLGGVWVDEHREPAERERVRARQQAALAALGDDPAHAVLRQRLRTRLAAEAVYTGAPLEPVLAALAGTRRLGDRQALAEALSLTHHALLRPDHAADRLPLADELVAVAAAAGDGVLVLMGLCWRAVDLFGLGDPGAERALAELRARADAVGCRSILYVVSAMDVMLLIRAGRLAEAERAAEASARLGRRGRRRGRGGVRGGAPADHPLAAGPRRRAAGAGRPGRRLAGAGAGGVRVPRHRGPARRGGRRSRPGPGARWTGSTAGGLAALPLSSTWLVGMLAVVEAAAALGDARVGGGGVRAAPAVRGPADDAPRSRSSCFGSTERALGLAALTRGRPDAAVRHLDRAVAANARLGHRPMTAVSRADLAVALRRRGAPGDRERAAALLAAAADEADGMDMPVRARAWRALGAAGDPVRARREQRHWVVSWGERRAVVEDLVGMRHLARLLARPGRAGARAGAGRRTPPRWRPGRSRQPVLDGPARRAYADRARRLVAELADARERADRGRVAVLEREADALADELGRSTGALGRTRDFPAPAERARTAVRKAIKRAVDGGGGGRPRDRRRAARHRHHRLLLLPTRRRSGEQPPVVRDAVLAAVPLDGHGPLRAVRPAAGPAGGQRRDRDADRDRREDVVVPDVREQVEDLADHPADREADDDADRAAAGPDRRRRWRR